MTDKSTIDEVHEKFSIDTKEIDIDEEEIEKKLEETPEWDMERNIEIASEIWQERINNIDDREKSSELEHHKRRIDELHESIDEFQESVNDLQNLIDEDSED